MNPTQPQATTSAKKQAQSSSRLDSLTLNLEQVESILETVLKTNIVPFLWGPPGVGKSSLIKAVADKGQYKLIDLRLSLLSPIDFRGLPVINKEEKQADWYPPAFLPKYNEKEKGILFLDEINLAPLATQHAAYQLILDKRVGEYRFPPHWFIIAAGNRETDKANVYRLPAPLANRFIHFDIYPDLFTWANWAKGKVRPEIIQYLSGQPAQLYIQPQGDEKGFPSPRSWSFLSELLDKSGFDISLAMSEELKHIILGTIGEASGRQFIAYLASYDAQKITAIVENFINTGIITLPRNAKDKQPIILSLVKYFKAGRINQATWDTFVSKLTSEEQKAVHAHIKQVENELQPLQPDKDYALTMVGCLKTSLEILVDSDDCFEDTGTAELTNPSTGFREIISYKKMRPKTLGILSRGGAGTQILDFPTGSIVKPIY